AYDADRCPDLQVAPVPGGPLLRFGDALRALLRRLHGVEVHIGEARGEGAPGGRGAGVHHQRRLAVARTRRALHTLQPEVAAVEVEGRLARPDPPDDRPPLRALLVAGVVLLLCYAEHAELVLDPAADHVDPEAPLADVVRGGNLLGGHHRMVERHVQRREYVDPSRGGQQARRPRHGLPAIAVRVALAAVALPARD